MTTYTITAYRGIDPNDGENTLLAIVKNPEGTIEACTALNDVGMAAGLFESPELFTMFLGAGVIELSAVNKEAQRVIDDVALGNWTELWSTEVDGVMRAPGDGPDDESEGGDQ